MLHSERVVFNMLNPDLSVHTEFSFSAYSSMLPPTEDVVNSLGSELYQVIFWPSEKGIVAVVLELGGCLEAGD